jgi:hypothetical protein
MLALTLLVASAFPAQSAPSQGVPAGIIGLPKFPAVPYVAGLSIGPDFTDEPFAVEADTLDFAARFWTSVDTGDPSALAAFQWSAEAQAWMSPRSSGGAGFQFDPWAGGFELFEHVYQHRLHSTGGATSLSIAELVETDVVVATTFKHWSLTRQLVTSPAWDPIAHTRHVELLVDALFFRSKATVRGVPLVLPDLIVSDRLEVESWAALSPGVAYAVSGAVPDDPQACIDALKSALAGFEGLYVADGKACYFGLVDGAPGFDCDDFADAIGAYIANKCRNGLTYANIYCSFVALDSATGKKRGRVGHLVTMIKSDSSYWLVDGQTGASSGPHPLDTPPDAAPILGGYSLKSGTVKTSSKQHAPNDRGPWSGEPPPWHESPAMVEHFENVTGFGAGCFIQ